MHIYNNKMTIFLSHSHCDIEKIRKIRDFFETLNYEPIMFFLKCLDDNNETLEQFIKDEIMARDIFIYCKSSNSEKSIWCQKELEYIREFDEKRLYEIDIDIDLSESLVSIINAIMSIIKKNRIFISCSKRDETISNTISNFLKEKGYEVFGIDNEISKNLHSSVEKRMKQALENGCFLSIITHNYLNSEFCMDEYYAAKYFIKTNNRGSILPIVLKNEKTEKTVGKLLPTTQNILVSEYPTDEELRKINLCIKNL